MPINYEVLMKHNQNVARLNTIIQFLNSNLTSLNGLNESQPSQMKELKTLMSDGINHINYLDAKNNKTRAFPSDDDVLLTLSIINRIENLVAYKQLVANIDNNQKHFGTIDHDALITSKNPSTDPESSIFKTNTAIKEFNDEHNSLLKQFKNIDGKIKEERTSNKSKTDSININSLITTYNETVLKHLSKHKNIELQMSLDNLDTDKQVHILLSDPKELTYIEKYTPTPIKVSSTEATEGGYRSRYEVLKKHDLDVARLNTIIQFLNSNLTSSKGLNESQPSQVKELKTLMSEGIKLINYLDAKNNETSAFPSDDDVLLTLSIINRIEDLVAYKQLVVNTDNNQKHFGTIDHPERDKVQSPTSAASVNGSTESASIGSTSEQSTLIPLVALEEALVNLGFGNSASFSDIKNDFLHSKKYIDENASNEREQIKSGVDEKVRSFTTDGKVDEEQSKKLAELQDQYEYLITLKLGVMLELQDAEPTLDAIKNAYVSYTNTHALKDDEENYKQITDGMNLLEELKTLKARSMGAEPIVPSTQATFTPTDIELSLKNVGEFISNYPEDEQTMGSGSIGQNQTPRTSMESALIQPVTPSVQASFKDIRVQYLAEKKEMDDSATALKNEIVNNINGREFETNKQVEDQQIKKQAELNNQYEYLITLKLGLMLGLTKDEPTAEDINTAFLKYGENVLERDENLFKEMSEGLAMLKEMESKGLSVGSALPNQEAIDQSNVSMESKSIGSSTNAQQTQEALPSTTQSKGSGSNKSIESDPIGFSNTGKGPEKSDVSRLQGFVQGFQKFKHLLTGKKEKMKLCDKETTTKPPLGNDEFNVLCNSIKEDIKNMKIPDGWSYDPGVVQQKQNGISEFKIKFRGPNNTSRIENEITVHSNGKVSADVVGLSDDEIKHFAKVLFDAYMKNKNNTIDKLKITGPVDGGPGYKIKVEIDRLISEYRPQDTINPMRTP